MLPAALEDAIAAALTAATDAGELPAIDVTIEVERPREPEHGDWASNVALAAAKQAGASPRDVAETITRHLGDVPHLAGVEVAGPGFLNFRMAASWGHEVVRRAAVDPEWGRGDLGAGTRVLVEFVSSNPTGPLHIGHGRGAVLGDSLCRLLDIAGFDVGREYYMNDAGAQIDRFGESLRARYLEVLGRDATVPEDGYHGEYVLDWARELAAEHGETLVGDVDAITRWGVDRAMRDMTETLELAGVRFEPDEYFRERYVFDRGEVEEVLDLLRDAGHLYQEDGATWFRTTTFGDEKDRVLVRSDGSPTYILPDIAYHWDKYRRGHDLLINVWGSDHHGYVAREHAGVAALGQDPASLEIIITQLVKVIRDGEEMKMSTRAGEFIPFRFVLDQVGTDATRYFLGAFSPDTTVRFDLDVARSQSMDNPVYYLQYAHARMRSLQRFAAEQGVDPGSLDDADLGLLDHVSETDLIRQMDRLPEELEIAALRRAPHRLAAYGQELAGAFHRFYTECRVVGDDVPLPLSAARLWLIEAARNTLVTVLAVLGISAPESM